jgi:hypothetical protein
MSKNPLFVEVESFQRIKHGMNICGDAVHSVKMPEECRVVTTLSDGLGSGVKANVLASMTAHMATKFVASNVDLTRSSEIMMDALPVCQVRKISYATFTVIDCNTDGRTKIVEMENPPFLLVRDKKVVPTKGEELSLKNWENRSVVISELNCLPEDRIITFSDGVSQAGIGSLEYPLGWRNNGCQDFVLKVLQEEPEISARKLSRLIVEEAEQKEPNCLAGDDISCTVVYFRKPRKTMILTGPPFDEEKDEEFAYMLEYFEGKKVVCGGTTSNIIERELALSCEIDISDIGKEVPATSKMEGIDLVTEGILTLTKTAKLLKTGEIPEKTDGATKLTELLLDSDEIQFVVGTKINEAHQDPTLPVDLEIRRNMIKKIARRLKNKYRKEVSIEYI